MGENLQKVENNKVQTQTTQEVHTEKYTGTQTLKLYDIIVMLRNTFYFILCFIASFTV